MKNSKIVKATADEIFWLKASSGKDISHCQSCGRSFLRKNGHSHTGMDQGKEFTVWCCSEPCLEWFHDRKPAHKARDTIEKKLNDVPLFELKVVAGPPGTVGISPYQSVIDATERIKAKPPVDNPCLWCGYSMDDEPEAKGDFCRPKCREWYLAAQKTTKKENKKMDKKTTPTKKKIDLMTKVRMSPVKEAA